MKIIICYSDIYLQINQINRVNYKLSHYNNCIDRV